MSKKTTAQKMENSDKDTKASQRIVSGDTLETFDEREWRSRR